MRSAYWSASVPVVLVLIVGCGSGDLRVGYLAKEAAPMQAARMFSEAADTGNYPRARAMIASVDGLSEELRLHDLNHVFEIMSEFEDERWFHRILEYKQDGDCAVVIVHEWEGAGSAFDLDPLYLIRQNGAWKVSPGFTDYEYLVESDETLSTRFEQLKTWFKQRKKELYEQRSQ